jgi:predicted Zn-dependent protease
MLTRIMIRTSTVLIAILIVNSCATVPVTGRKQLDLVSNDDIIQQSAVEYKHVLDSSKLSTNADQVDMIRRVGKRIQGAVENYMSQKGLSDQLKGFNWEFNLIQDDKTVNAWCMPGGKVAFYTGILPICKDETGISIVMGHEVAHAIANHGRERMSQAMLENGLLTTIGAAMGQNPTLTQQLLLQSIGVGTNVTMLKFSRQDESEADHIGLIFMTIAGYDPNQAPIFWQRMQNTGGQKPPEFLSTHPSDATRIKDIQSWIPEALTYQKK